MPGSCSISPARQVDTFILSAPNVGVLQRLRLRCSGGLLGAAWHLAKVEVVSAATGETCVFPFNKCARSSEAKSKYVA
jgi:hypothetical protein